MNSLERRLLLTVTLSLGAVTLLTPSGCDRMVRKVTREPRAFSYVGQVEFGEPVKGNGQVIIPLSYTGGEWARNSAIVPVQVDTTLKDTEIEMTVTTSVATNAATHGHQLVLPEHVAGEYTVYYRDPDGTRHEIGSIEIPE